MKLTLTWKLYLFQFLLAGIFLLPSSINANSNIKILDGSERTIWYTTNSMNAGGRLSKFLDAYFKSKGKTNPIKVKPTGKMQEFTGVASDGKGGYKPTKWLEEIRTKGVKGGAVGPNDVFIAQSDIGLNKLAFISDTTAKDQIDESIRQLKFMCDEVKRVTNAAVIMWSTYHYAFAHVRLNQNQNVVVREFNRRFLPEYRAIPLGHETLKEYPYGNSSDMFHPNAYGSMLDSYIWFKALAEHDGVAIPPEVTKLVDDMRQKNKEMQARIRYKGPITGDFKLGDTIWVEWEADEDIQKLQPALLFTRIDTIRKNHSYMNGIKICMANLNGSLRTASCEIKRGDKRWGRLPFVLTQAVFDKFLMSKGKKVESRIPITFPIPIIISLSYAHLSGGRISLGPSSFPHWTRPDSMIYIHPFKSIQENRGKYPEVLHQKENPSSLMRQREVWGNHSKVEFDFFNGVLNIHTGMQSATDESVILNPQGKKVSRPLVSSP